MNQSSPGILRVGGFGGIPIACCPPANGSPDHVQEVFIPLHASNVCRLRINKSSIALIHCENAASFRNVRVMPYSICLSKDKNRMPSYALQRSTSKSERS